MIDPRSAQPGSYHTSGHGAETEGQTQVTALSGRASARPGRPGAASPAGWSPPPAGEAAPPVRSRGPARSDGNSGVPEARWLSLTRLGPRHIPVVGPTEALHGRPGGPGMAAPRGAATGPHGHQRRSGWQLAHQAWQDAGVEWETVPASNRPDPHEPPRYEPDPYAPGLPGSYERNLPEPTAYGPNPYQPGPYEPDPDEPEPYEPDLAEPEPYEPDLAEPEPYEPAADGILVGGSQDFRFPDDREVAGPPATGPTPVGPGRSSAGDRPGVAASTTGAAQADTHVTRPDLPVVREPADSHFGIGPWPVQQPAAVTQPQPVLAGRPADHGGPAEERGQSESWPPAPAPRSFPPPRPAAPRSTAIPSSAFAAPGAFGAPPAYASPRPSAPLGAPVDAPPLSAAAPPRGEPDELFRAWQGSVDQATARRTTWPAPRPAGSALRPAGPALSRPAAPPAAATPGRWRGSACPPR